MVEQLRREAAIKRINVSQAIEDIKVKYYTPMTPPKSFLLCGAIRIEYSLMFEANELRRIYSKEVHSFYQ